MEDWNEKAEELLNKPLNLIKECKKSLEIQTLKYNRLKKEIIEWEGALIRANLPFKKIEFKGKKQTIWRLWK